MEIYSIRTQDDEIIIWDDEEQLAEDGGYNEMFTPVKEIALSLLKHISKIHPDTKFKLVAFDSTNVAEVKSYTIEDIEQKAIEEKERRVV